MILETEELNHESINYDLTQIKSYPAISILQKDVKNFLKSVHRQEASIILWSERWDNIFEDDIFYTVDCNLPKQCIHLYTPHTQQVYLGCNGVPKYRTNPSMNCSYKGAECTELVKLKGSVHACQSF